MILMRLLRLPFDTQDRYYRTLILWEKRFFQHFRILSICSLNHLDIFYIIQDILTLWSFAFFSFSKYCRLLLLLACQSQKNKLTFMTWNSHRWWQSWSCWACSEGITWTTTWASMSAGLLQVEHPLQESLTPDLSQFVCQLWRSRDGLLTHRSRAGFFTGLVDKSAEWD